jgi:putative ABC transport system permease protein
VTRVSNGQAATELRAVQSRIAADHPGEDKDISAELVPMHEQLFGKLRPLLLALLGVAALLFCVAWASAAHLFLVRAVARAHETAVRIALGATRASLWRLSFADAFLLSLVAGAIGLGLAAAARGTPSISLCR